MHGKLRHLMSALSLLFFVVIAFGSSEGGEGGSESSSSSNQTREEKIEAQFSAWDGSHSKLKAVIKDAMNNPKSFEHVETVYWDMGDYLVVQTTFRGENAFGGTVKNWVKAKVDINSGNVLEIMEQGP